MVIFLLFLVLQNFEEEVSETIIDQLQTLKDNPIYINTATKEDLTKIYWISPELAKSIIKTRGKMLKIYDISRSRA